MAAASFLIFLHQISAMTKQLVLEVVESEKCPTNFRQNLVWEQLELDFRKVPVASSTEWIRWQVAPAPLHL